MVPSSEVRIVPDSPTATKVLLPKVIPFKVFDVPEETAFHEVPSSEVVIIP